MAGGEGAGRVGYTVGRAAVGPDIRRELDVVQARVGSCASIDVVVALRAWVGEVSGLSRTRHPPARG